MKGEKTPSDWCYVNTNVKHLMLKSEVLKAVSCKEKKFVIYAIKSIDEGISILTGVEVDDKKKNQSEEE